MSPVRRWLSRLLWPLLLLVCAGLFAAMFGVGIIWWHIARDLSWWTFGVFFMLCELINPVTKAVRDVTRKTRRKP